jgi:hypothetical protein
MTITLSEPDHEHENLGIPATGEPAIDATGALLENTGANGEPVYRPKGKMPKKRALSRLFMFRVSEDMHARIKALGGSKWLRSVIEERKPQV